MDGIKKSGQDRRDEDNPKKIEHVSDLIGDYGPFQRFNSWGHAVFSIIYAFIVLALPFYAPPVQVMCDDDPENFINGTVPEDYCQCKSWRYNSSMEVNIISEWDLICDRSWIPSATQSAYMIAQFVSYIVVSPLIDRFGRKPLFLIGLVAEIGAGLACAMASGIIQFTVARSIVGVAIIMRSSGAGLMAFEFLGPESRTWWNMFGIFLWVGGYMIMPLFAYLLRNFRYLLLLGTLPLIPYLVISYWLPESPRWLMSRKRFDEAKELLEKAAKRNGLYDDKFDDKFEQLKSNFIKSNLNQSKPGKKKKSAIVQLLTMKHFLVMLSIISYASFVHSLIWYGISLNMDKFGGDIFISFFLGALSELPGDITNFFLVRYAGRRTLVALHDLGAGACCLAFIWLQDPTLVTLRMSFALIGKTLIVGSAIYLGLMTKELFPTVVRESSHGITRAVSRIGSILAPFSKELAQATSLPFVFILYGVLATSCGLLMRFLPETRGVEIPDTIHEMKDFARKKSKKRPQDNDDAGETCEPFKSGEQL